MELYKYADIVQDIKVNQNIKGSSLKVLEICAAYKPAYIYGGPTMSVSMLSEQLVKAGIATKVYATTANGFNELPVVPDQEVFVDGVPVTYFKRITKDHSHFSPSMLKALRLKVDRFQIVHIHAWWNLVSLLSCFTALNRGVPVILSPRGTLSSYSFQNKNIGPKWLIHNALGKRLLSKCHIHVTSERERSAIISLVKPKSITVLPNFVKLPAKSELNDNIPVDYLRLLFFSRIEEKKGLDILLDALKRVTVPYYLTIAGDGNPAYIDYLKGIAKANKIEDKINWAGFHTDNKFDLLHDHDLFVLPSHDENFGNVVIESLSVGTPVLISEHVGLADYVEKNNLGWICQITPASVSAAIDEIGLNKTPDLKRIRKQAPEIIYNDFNEENLVKRYIEMYTHFINN